MTLMFSSETTAQLKPRCTENLLMLISICTGTPTTAWTTRDQELGHFSIEQEPTSQTNKIKRKKSNTSKKSSTKTNGYKNSALEVPNQQDQEKRKEKKVVKAKRRYSVIIDLIIQFFG